jgi:hypothetical protein
MTLEPSRRTSARKLAVFAAVFAAACAGALAKAPPAEPAAFARVVVVPGAVIVNAAKSARALQDAGFATRRFSSDSTWGTRAADDIAARLRYSSPSRDSTRVLVELWGKCERGGTNCLLGEFVRLVSILTTEEAPPT